MWRPNETCRKKQRKLSWNCDCSYLARYRNRPLLYRRWCNFWSSNSNLLSLCGRDSKEGLAMYQLWIFFRESLETACLKTNDLQSIIGLINHIFKYAHMKNVTSLTSLRKRWIKEQVRVRHEFQEQYLDSLEE